MGSNPFSTLANSGDRMSCCCSVRKLMPIMDIGGRSFLQARSLGGKAGYRKGPKRYSRGTRLQASAAMRSRPLQRHLRRSIEGSVDVGEKPLRPQSVEHLAGLPKGLRRRSGVFELQE